MIHIRKGVNDISKKKNLHERERVIQYFLCHYNVVKYEKKNFYP